MIINRGAAHPYENQAAWAIGMRERIDYQVYKKHLLLTLSIDFNREDLIYRGVGIREGAGHSGRRGWSSGETNQVEPELNRGMDDVDGLPG